jgi:hypothetical protein
MPATALTKLNWTGPYPTALSALTFTAGDNTNGNSFRMSGNDLLLVYNSAGSSGTFTLQGPANARNRTGTITTESIAAGAIKVLGPFKKLDGWQNSDGVRVTPSASTIKFAVIRLR